MTTSKNLSLPQINSQLIALKTLCFSLPRSDTLKLFLYFLLTLFLKLFEETLVYLIGKQTSKIYSTLTDISKRSEFYKILLIGFALVLGVAIIKSFSKFLENRWTLEFRKCLSLKVLEEYFIKGNFIKVTRGGGNVDNPDQRLTEELDLYCEKIIKLITNLLTLPFLIIYYTLKTINLTGWKGVLVIFFWFLIGSGISYTLIYKVSKVLRIVEQEKSNYRKYQIELIQNSELIQTYNSYTYHKLILLKKFLKLINSQLDLIFKNYLLLINLNLMDYSGSILTYTIISIPILLGYFDDKSASELSELISLNSFQCMYLIYQLTSFLHQSEILSEWLGHSIRLNELISEFNSKSEHEQDNEDKIELEESLQLLNELQTDNEEEIEYKINLVNVDLINFKNEFVFQNFNFELNNGENLIIKGANGIGKSSLAKLMSNLIEPTNGHIIRQGLNLPGQLVYFNQKLMIIEGSLLDQITYPNSIDYYFNSEFNLRNNEGIVKLLKLVKLEEQFKPEDFEVNLSYSDWCNKYSLGTLTKLNLIRVFLLKPKLIILDEITQTLDNASELEILSNLEKFGIGFVLISHKLNSDQFNLRQLRVLEL